MTTGPGVAGRINGRYGAAWWALVYAAQPSYRAKRENLPLTGSLIEQEAERSAILDCQQRGILDGDHMPEWTRRNYRPERAAPRFPKLGWWIG
jgi:hypothetical protein